MGREIKKLTVVIPCCNEEGNVGRFKEEVFDFFKSLEFDTEYVAVDDGSTDGTAAALEALKRSESNLTVVRHERNSGLGAALRSGFAAARGEAVLTLDADLTFHPREFPRLWEAFTAETDAVLGSPFLGLMTGVSVGRRFLSAAVNRIYRALLDAPITATSSVFRLYRKATLDRLELTSVSFDINAEIVFKILKGGGQVREVPVTLGDRSWGSSKINLTREILNHIKMFGQILRWRFS